MEILGIMQSLKSSKYISEVWVPVSIRVAVEDGRVTTFSICEDRDLATDPLVMLDILILDLEEISSCEGALNGEWCGTVTFS